MHPFQAQFAVRYENYHVIRVQYTIKQTIIDLTSHSRSHRLPDTYTATTRDKGIRPPGRIGPGAPPCDGTVRGFDRRAPRGGAGRRAKTDGRRTRLGRRTLARATTDPRDPTLVLGSASESTSGRRRPCSTPSHACACVGPDHGDAATARSARTARGAGETGNVRGTIPSVSEGNTEPRIATPKAWPSRSPRLGDGEGVRAGARCTSKEPRRPTRPKHHSHAYRVHYDTHITRRNSATSRPRREATPDSAHGATQ